MTAATVPAPAAAPLVALPRLPGHAEAPAVAVSPRVVLEGVCAEFDVDEARILGPRSDAWTTRARRALCQRLRDLCGMRVGEIAVRVRRDHSTVSYLLGNTTKGAR